MPDSVDRADEVRSIDVMHVAPVRGRRFRELTVLDDGAGKAFVIVADRPIDAEDGAAGVPARPRQA